MIVFTMFKGASEGVYEWMKVTGMSDVGRRTGASDHPDDHTDIQ